MTQFDDHYMRHEDLTQKQKEAIAELRRRVKKDLEVYPGYDTDFSLLRWLLGWNYDIDVIVPKLRWAIQVVTALQLHQMDFTTPDKVNKYVNEMAPGTDYFPGGLMGEDRDGNVIFVQPLSKAHPKTVSKLGRVTDLFRLSIAECEGAFQIIRKNETKFGRKMGVKIIIDLDGFSMDLLYKPTLKIYLNLLTLLQAMFPDFARQIYVVNAPTMVHAAYALVSPVLSKQTRDKISILSSNWKEVVVEDFGAEYIFPQWGGIKSAFKPTGTIRMGGVVPEEMRYNPQTSPFEVHESQLQKINVSRQNQKEISLQVNHKGAKIKWFFRTSGDIDFFITFKEQEVWPRFRTMTEFVPEYGHIVCEHPGEYVFVFDNHHSTFTSKDVKYVISIE